MTYDLIDRAVRRANPVPDPARLDHKPPPALGTLAREGLTMQLIEHPTDQRTPGEPDGPRRSRWVLLAGAAAAVIVAFVVGMIVANRDAEPSPPADSVAPVETLEAVPPAEPTLLTRAMESNAIAPGEYLIDTDGDPATSTSATLTIEGDRWFAVQPGVGRDHPGSDAYSFAVLVAQIDRVNAAGCATTRFQVEERGDPDHWTEVANTPRALGDALVAMPEVTVIDPVAATTAFGYDGYHLTLAMPSCPQEYPGPQEYLGWEGPTFGRTYHQGMTAEYWVLDVDGVVVLVEAAWQPFSAVEDRDAVWDAISSLEITP